MSLRENFHIILLLFLIIPTFHQYKNNGTNGAQESPGFIEFNNTNTYLVSVLGANNATRKWK